MGKLLRIESKNPIFCLIFKEIQILPPFPFLNEDSLTQSDFQSGPETALLVANAT